MKKTILLIGVIIALTSCQNKERKAYVMKQHSEIQRYMKEHKLDSAKMRANEMLIGNYPQTDKTIAKAYLMKIREMQ